VHTLHVVIGALRDRRYIQIRPFDCISWSGGRQKLNDRPKGCAPWLLFLRDTFRLAAAALFDMLFASSADSRT
jgi:hypothetical protein